LRRRFALWCTIGSRELDPARVLPKRSDCAAGDLGI
jgi:hypothetical protein